MISKISVGTSVGQFSTPRHEFASSSFATPALLPIWFALIVAYACGRKAIR